MKKFALILMTLSCVIIGLYAIGFQLRLIGNPAFLAHFDSVPVAGTLHVMCGAIVLVIGALQFWSGLRAKHPALHRCLGRVYLTLVLVGGIAGLILAPQSSGGIAGHFAFGLLAVLWLFSGAKAYTSIRAGDVKTHREWMIRNFALTLAAVTLRIYIGLFLAAGVPFADAYPAIAWLAWVPNLILAEWILAIKRQPLVEKVA